MSPPFISIVMTVYNNYADLPAALDSILAQTYRNWELILIDDGSTDGSSEIMDEYQKRDPRIRVIHQPNAGLGPALFRGCSEAKGDWIARHDGDDWSEPTRFQRQVDYLSRNGDVVAFGTWAWFVHPTEGRQFALKIPDNDALHKQFLTSGLNPFLHGSIMMLRTVYEKEKYRFRCGMVEDIDLWIRLGRHGRLGMLESLEYNYRLSPNGICFTLRNVNDALVKLVLQLDKEWRTNGKELTDWEKSEKRITDATPKLKPTERKSADHFMNGIHCLKRRRYDRFWELMILASQGEGQAAGKAKLVSKLNILPSFLRNLASIVLRSVIIYKNRKNIDPYIEYVQ